MIIFVHPFRSSVVGYWEDIQRSNWLAPKKMFQLTPQGGATDNIDRRHYFLLRFKGKGMVLYSAVSSPLDRSKRFTLSSPGRPVHSETVLGFSWKHSSHAAIAQRLFTHISTTVYSQVLIYTAESTEAS